MSHKVVYTLTFLAAFFAVLAVVTPQTLSTALAQILAVKQSVLGLKVNLTRYKLNCINASTQAVINKTITLVTNKLQAKGSILSGLIAVFTGQNVTNTQNYFQNIFNSIINKYNATLYGCLF